MKKQFNVQPGIRMSARHMGVGGLVLACVVSAFAQGVADDSGAVGAIWRARPDMANPATRAGVVSQLRAIHRIRRESAEVNARARGLPLRETLPNRTVRELVGWRDDRPLYLTTLNENAAISTGANLLRASPYEVDGSGWTVGVWDATGVLTNHQEFVGRATVRDLAHTNLHWHSTHVAGTIGATGVSPSAMGMARAVRIDSYDWNDDAAETSARGASYGGEPGAIYLSNHSYGMISGWLKTGQTAPAAAWEWHGSGTTAAGYEPFFGQYNDAASGVDAQLHSLPYYSSVWAAGNDRDDNPALSDPVALSPGGTVVAYDPALHPPGDGVYWSGHDNIGFYGIAKNVITIGAVEDAVTSGQRNPAEAGMLNFSSWGPADDGRIKPDLVANGYYLYSPQSAGTASYATSSGTSMAAPNATGTAQLLLSLYRKLLPGQYLRASTLKGLLIHTADDLGTAGPDYQFGWGLINAKAAADLIVDVATNFATPRMLEQQLTSSVTTRTHAFMWDGVSPIHATLCWTDPAGAATTLHDSRAATLVNNLNLRIEDPNGNSQFPFVMPFVGTWTSESLSSPATTGTNDTDNVEQVRVATPTVPGQWKAIVSVDGALADGVQHYSLLLSGSAPMPPQPTSISPDHVSGGTAQISILGETFASGAQVTFFRDEFPPVEAVTTHVTATQIDCILDSSQMGQGGWHVRVTSPDSQIGEFTNALDVVTQFGAADFEVTPFGWSTFADPGTTYWTITNTTSHTPSNAWFASGPDTRNTDNLTSRGFVIPAVATAVRLSFWHTYNTEDYDGCVLELSSDDGVNWKAVGDAGSGAAFVRGGYTGQIAGKTGPPANRAELFESPAWTGTGGGAFTEVVLALDSDVYAGSTLRVRWRLSTDSSIASPGWTVDTFEVYGYSPFTGTRLLFF